MSTTAERVKRALREPRSGGLVVWGLLCGFYYRIKYAWIGRRLRVGNWFRVEGRLDLRGPGIVHLGDRVHIGDTTHLWTYDPSACIEVGDGCYLNGAHLWCRSRISLGRGCLIGPAELMDTDFHSVHVDRHDPRAPVRTLPIMIADNVWLARRAAILPGCTIGPDAVIGYGAVCTGHLEGGMIYVGNPARPVAEVPRSPLNQGS